MNDTLNEFSSEVDGRRYLKPELATQENDAFIQNLRSVQAQQNAEIQKQTENLGSYPASQSNLGGLGGAEPTWIDKYQTAPTNNLVADLRATAQAQALTQVLQNEVDYLQNKYKRLYQSKVRSAKNGGPTTTTDGDGSPWDGEFDEEETDGGLTAYTAQGIGGASRSSKQPAGSTWTTYERDNYIFTQDQDGHIVNTDHPDYRKASNGFFYQVGQQNDIWNGDPKTRAENLSQLEKIRAAAKAQGK